jgi:trk system potassium uptake protein TrkA
MKYIIIGLGNYGHVLAEELSALGHYLMATLIMIVRQWHQ